VTRIALSVITAREPVTGNAWIQERWRVMGVVAAGEPSQRLRTTLRSAPDGDQYLWHGLVLQLHPAEVESYYYNLIGSNPSLYIYCHEEPSGEPCPRFVTAEYIDAMTHSETGNSTHAVPMPPEVYRRIEQYVLEHYVPEEPRQKRKHEQRMSDDE
jgi:hypothetical protein